jgi:hypothetical protein
MKTLKNTVWGLIGLTLMLAACKKEDPIQPNPQPTTNVALKNYFKAKEQAAVQTFTIDAQNPEVITGSKGTKVYFQANAFQHANGQVVTGSVEIKLIEILDKKDMILLNKPTMANHPMGGIAPLISGGEFRITAYQNGNPLQLVEGSSYLIDVPAPNGVDPQMQAFVGDNTGDTLVWNQMDSSAVWGQGNAYQGYFNDLGWINLDYFYNDPRPQTTVQVQIPAGHTNQTCTVFISFDGMNSISSFWNYSAGVYTTAPNYTLPVGLEVHFIALAITNAVPHVAIVGATIENNHLEVISALTATTDAQLEADLSNLP